MLRLHQMSPLVWLSFLLLLTGLPLAVAETAVFPGAVGFGAQTAAGRGGRVLKVTTLAADGPGSLREALQAEGPRIVVFEVGGLIDLAGRSLRLSQPFVTVAGQTAPDPGITLIRGGLSVSTHDVLLQHIRIRTGDAGRAKKSGWEVDGLATDGAWNVVVDHCSIAWATDENLSASGPRFEGRDLDAWRQHTSHDVTFSHCIVAEGLHQSTHGKGGHSKGSLIHDNATRIAVIGNLYASNVDRNPLFKGGVRGVVVNNLIDNPKSKAVHYRLVSSEWIGHPPVTGQMVLVGNVLQYGPDTEPGRALLSFDGDGPLELFARDNLAYDRTSQPVETVVVAGAGKAEDLRRLSSAPLWPDGLNPLPPAEVRAAVLREAGARPWDRDVVDARILRQVEQRQGRVIDSQEEVGGYPVMPTAWRQLDVPPEGVEQWLQGFCRAAQESEGP